MAKDNAHVGSSRSVPKDQELITVTQAAVELESSRHRVLVAVAMEGVELRVIGGSYVFRRSSLDRIRARLDFCESPPVPAA
jgi:hypothetical protein